MERLRVLYKGRERIPNIREATFTQREKRSHPDCIKLSLQIQKVLYFDLDFMLIISLYRPGWEYKTRSRYIVKPSLVHEVDIHNLVSTLSSLFPKLYFDKFLGRNQPSFLHCGFSKIDFHIFQVDIHNVVRSVPGFKTMELSRDHVALAHFRFEHLSQKYLSTSQMIISHFRLQGERESFPGLAEEQEEDLNLVRGWTPNLLDRVNKVLFNSC